MPSRVKLRTLSSVPMTGLPYGCFWNAVAKSSRESLRAGESAERLISSQTTSISRFNSSPSKEALVTASASTSMPSLKNRLARTTW